MSETQLPQFLFTYWNPFDEKKPDFADSLDTYVKDVQLANYTGKVVGKFLQQQTEQQLAAIADMTREISNVDDSINFGFSQINQRLSLVQVEQFNTNLLLKDIKEILKQPDSEKKRIKYIELGMKFFNQALKNEEIINDAIEQFEKALALMKQDWLTAYQLGICYTYHKSVQNLEKAEKLFLSAAKYSAVDTLDGDDFKDYFYSTISIQSTNENVLLDFAAECYLQVAFIRYVQSDFEGAVEFATKATQVSDKNPKAFFILAKYLTRLGKDTESIESLQKADTIDKNIYKVFAMDIDIIKNEHFGNFYPNLIKTREIKREEYAKEIGTLIIVEIIDVIVWNSLLEYFSTAYIKYNYHCKIKEAIEKQYDELKIIGRFHDEYNHVKLSAANKVVDMLIKRNCIIEFITQAVKDAKEYLKLNFKKNLEWNKKYFNEYKDIYRLETFSIPALTLEDDVKESTFQSIVIVQKVFEKFVSKSDLLRIYILELKQAGVFDKIKICGNNSYEIEACKIRLEDFINVTQPRDINYLVDAFEDERVQKEKKEQAGHNAWIITAILALPISFILWCVNLALMPLFLIACIFFIYVYLFKRYQ